jgi:NADH-quinone oxidoreductase subunit J
MEDVGPQVNKNWWLVGIVSAGLFATLSLVLSGWGGFSTTTRAVAEGGEDLVVFGKSLVDPAGFMIPFEVASLLLLAAMIGAIYVAGFKMGGKE